MNHFINFKDFTPDYLENIIDQALEMKKYPSQYARVLEGKNLYMLFQKTSTRTALSFAFGIPRWAAGISSRIGRTATFRLLKFRTKSATFRARQI